MDDVLEKQYLVMEIHSIETKEIYGRSSTLDLFRNH